jgi:Zn finger protein HypA/HybF involved in hydrogenase expression
MTTRDDHSAPGRGGSQTPPRLFECKLCGKVFDAREARPTCPECDSSDVEQVG